MTQAVRIPVSHHGGLGSLLG